MKAVLFKNIEKIESDIKMIESKKDYLKEPWRTKKGERGGLNNLNNNVVDCCFSDLDPDPA